MNPFKSYNQERYINSVNMAPWAGLSGKQPGHALFDDKPHQTGTNMDIGQCKDIITGLKGKAVLDVGCGDGWMVKKMMDMGLDAYGFTISQTDVDGAAKQGLGNRVHRGDMQRLPNWPEPLFHLVWCRHVLEHAIAPDLAMQEFRRVLHEDQWLFIGMPLESGPWVDVDVHYWVPTERQALALFRRNGFRVHKQWMQEHGTGQQSYLLRKN